MLIQMIKTILSKGKENHRLKEQNWIEKLNDLGFSKITFPILVKDGPDLALINELREYATDPDWYLFEFASDIELIDSKGQIWSWQYDRVNETNLPDKLKRVVKIYEIKNMITNYYIFKKLDKKYDMTEISGITDINKLFEYISDKQ